MTHLNLKTISVLEKQLSNPTHFGVKNPPESFSPFSKMEQVKITPLNNGHSQVSGSVEEQIFFTVFSEVTALAAANVLQFVGHGTATKKVIDFRGMLEAKITLENISKDYPVNFHVVSGEGARDDSFGLGNGDVIFKNNPTTPIDIEKFPKFKKRLLELGLNPKDFNGILPYQVELNIDVIDGTTFTSKEDCSLRVITKMA
jgi:fructose-1,6-bisphosphatase/sedoheptulose 1,7-bisphosphatase-like protein